MTDHAPLSQASQFARLALGCIQRELPHKLDHLIDDLSEIGAPRALHPAFYGCLDWHSAVHGHWMLVRLARRASRTSIQWPCTAECQSRQP